MDDQKQDPRNIKMRERVIAQIAALTIYVSRYRKNETALEQTERLLAEAREEHTRHSAVQSEMERLSPAELHRRGLKPEQAVAKADEAGSKAAAVALRETDLSTDRERIVAQLASDRAAAEKLLPDITYDAPLLTEGEFVAEIGAMIDLEANYVPTLTDGSRDRLFAMTRAYHIYENRRIRAVSKTEVRDPIALAEEILAEPIVPVRQGSPSLPWHESVLIRTINQRSGLEVIAPSEELDASAQVNSSPAPGSR